MKKKSKNFFFPCKTPLMYWITRTHTQKYIYIYIYIYILCVCEIKATIKTEALHIMNFKFKYRCLYRLVTYKMKWWFLWQFEKRNWRQHWSTFWTIYLCKSSILHTHQTITNGQLFLFFLNWKFISKINLRL